MTNSAPPALPDSTYDIVRLWDENWQQIDTVEQGWRRDQPMIITLSAQHPIGQYLADRISHTTVLHLTVDDGGKRLAGRLEEMTITKERGKTATVRAVFAQEHDLLAMTMTNVQKPLTYTSRGQDGNARRAWIAANNEVAELHDRTD